MKPFRFPIHGAIDGFSRKVLWLTVVKSNNNPVVPAALYLRAVKEHGVSPILLKTDCGSENDHGWTAMLLNQKFLLAQVLRVTLKPTYRNLVVTFSALIFWLGNRSFQRISS